MLTPCQSIKEQVLPPCESGACLKNALITGLVLSIILLIGGLVALCGVGGMGSAAAGTLTVLSGMLATGFLLLMLQSCKQNKSVIAESLEEGVLSEETSTCGRQASPRSLSRKDVVPLFRPGTLPVEDSYLTKELFDLLDEDQIDYLLTQTNNRLSIIPPECIKKFLTVDQADRVFPPCEDERNKKRLPPLRQEILNKLIEEEWESYALGALSPNQVKNLPFSKLTEKQLREIFPIYNVENSKELEGLKEKMKVVSVADIKTLIKKGFEGDWLILLSPEHVSKLERKEQKLVESQRKKLGFK